MGFWSRVKDVLVSGPTAAAGNAREEKKAEEAAEQAAEQASTAPVEVPEPTVEVEPEVVAPAETEYRTYTVKSGDTLSEIAQEQLGDADRWPEIYQASTGITQPGGAQLTDPDVIDVGWKLNIPRAEETGSHDGTRHQQPREVSINNEGRSACTSGLRATAAK